jgi:hypothetical protein
VIEQIALDLATTTGRVKRKINNTRKLRLTAARLTSYSKEVVVKVVNKFGKGPLQVGRQLAYISRKGELVLENEKGELLLGKDNVKALARDWGDDLGDTRRYKAQRDTMHMVLSMPEGTPEVSVERAAREFSKAQFANHEYVFVMHSQSTDPDPSSLKPHVHILVKMRGFDGKRLNPRKDDLVAWREAFAEAMRDQGEDAAATPRVSRGVTKKNDNQVMRHMRVADASHPVARVPKRDAEAIRLAADELIGPGGKGVEVRLPLARQEAEKRASALERAKLGQGFNRVAWLAAAEAMSQSRQTTPEMPNERPDYAALDPQRTRAVRRAAALYQSGLGADSRLPSAPAVASMRDVPGLALVQDEGPAQVLLHAHAPAGLGRRHAAHIEVRRPRAGARGHDGADQRLAEAEALVGDPAKLAERIRGFVAKFPDPELMESRHDRAKAELRALTRRQKPPVLIGPKPGTVPMDYGRDPPENDKEQDLDR